MPSRFRLAPHIPMRDVVGHLRGFRAGLLADLRSSSDPNSKSQRASSPHTTGTKARKGNSPRQAKFQSRQIVVLSRTVIFYTVQAAATFTGAQSVDGNIIHAACAVACNAKWRKDLGGPCSFMCMNKCDCGGSRACVRRRGVVLLR
jgi:hypothetical protein